MGIRNAKAPVKEARAADAKEVGVGDPAEETCRSPDHENVMEHYWACQSRCPTSQRFGERFARSCFPRDQPGLDGWGSCVCMAG
ncbi:MAG: hypothetical protein RIS76_3770 [Verrucomicrobiota bacterium]